MKDLDFCSRCIYYDKDLDKCLEGMEFLPVCTPDFSSHLYKVNVSIHCGDECYNTEFRIGGDSQKEAEQNALDMYVTINDIEEIK